MNDEQALTKSFRDHGFIFLRGFLCKPEVSELRDRIARFVREVVPRMPEEEVFYELKSDIATLKQLQRMFRYNP